jgi:hypothetical protein
VGVKGKTHRNTYNQGGNCSDAHSGARAGSRAQTVVTQRERRPVVCNVTTVNNNIYLKTAERINFKYSHHTQKVHM